MTVNAVLLRNRLPQNIYDIQGAREVAKDIACNDIEDYETLPVTVRKCIKHLLIGGLADVCHEQSKENRTLGALYHWIKDEAYQDAPDFDENEPHLKLVRMAPESDIQNARFHICDNLMKYEVCDQYRR